ncbi:MAG: hypothetical protein AAGK23_11980 [Pseudomonadota bacterium]
MLDELACRICLPAAHLEAYQSAVRAGDMAALKSVLLAVCNDEDRAMIEHLMPPELVGPAGLDV